VISGKYQCGNDFSTIFTALITTVTENKLYYMNKNGGIEHEFFL